MNDDKSFAAVVQALRAAHQVFPQQRVGQILSNAMGDASLFYIDDRIVADLLNRYMSGLPKGKLESEKTGSPCRGCSKQGPSRDSCIWRDGDCPE